MLSDISRRIKEISGLGSDVGFYSHNTFNNYYYKSQINYYNNIPNIIRMVCIYEEKESNYYWRSWNGFSCL